MPIPAATAHVQLVGTVAATESFACGFWLSGVQVDSQNAATNIANGIANTWGISSAPAAVKVLVPPDTSYTGVKVYFYDGVTAGAKWQATSTFAAATVGQSVASCPLQTSVVVSLLTGLPGRSNRGRLYLPAAGAALTTHLLSTADTQSIANGMADFFTKLNALNAGASGIVSVVSQAKGTANDVTSVRVDNKPDIQRRRAKSLAASQIKTAAVA